MKRIVSLWLPHFPTDRLHRLYRGGARGLYRGGVPAEQGSRPASPARPLVTLAAGRGGVRLAAVDRAALTHGLRPQMTLADARALLPALIAEPAEPAADRRALAALADWCGRYTPWTAVDPDATFAGEHGAGCGLLLDTTGCAHLFGGEAALLDDLLRRLHGLGFAARAALADSLAAAWALARFTTRAATVVPAGEAAAALAPLPVQALRLAAESVALLQRVGLRRIGDLVPLPRAPLAARFGEVLLQRLGQALGERDEPLSPRRPPPAFRARLAFTEPIGRSEDVICALDRLLADLCGRLLAAHRGARRLELALYRIDATMLRLGVGTSRPQRSAAHLARLFREKLETIDAGFGIEVMTLEAVVADPLPPEQPTLAAAPAAAGGDLAWLVDRLGNRLGTTAVVRLAPQSSHIPERACRELPAMAGESLPRPLSDAGDEQHAPRLPRPPLLLSPPEPVEVVAPVPDGPPALLRWRRDVLRISAAEGPERIGAEWWTVAAGHRSKAHEQVRDYWRVETIAGPRLWIYREGSFRALQPPRWYLHGLFE